VHSDKPRPVLANPATATAEELREVWGPFVAEGGTYELTENLITMHPIAAKNPAAMLMTLAEIAENETVKRNYTALAHATAHAATPQIRNVATIGGNLLQRPRCWYFRHSEFPCRRKGGEICFAQDGENQYHAIFDNHICAIVAPSIQLCR
jgi:FAD binding domain in molybdopterin dehydrogenase